jgi:hypothetical protein
LLSGLVYHGLIHDVSERNGTDRVMRPELHPDYLMTFRAPLPGRLTNAVQARVESEWANRHDTDSIGEAKVLVLAIMPLRSLLPSGLCPESGECPTSCQPHGAIAPRPASRQTSHPGKDRPDWSCSSVGRAAGRSTPVQAAQAPSGLTLCHVCASSEHRSLGMSRSARVSFGFPSL